MNENRNNEPRRPDCVTEVRMGNTVLVVSGYFKKDAAATAADKMMTVSYTHLDVYKRQADKARNPTSEKCNDSR